MKKTVILSAIALAAMLAACTDEPVTPGNSLMGYKWECVQKTIMDREEDPWEATVSFTLVFTSETDGKLRQVFKSPWENDKWDYTFVYSFDGRKGILCIKDESMYSGYDNSSFEMNSTMDTMIWHHSYGEDWYLPRMKL